MLPSRPSPLPLPPPRLCSSSSLLLLLIVLSSVLVRTTMACDFPYYMQTNSSDRDWRTHIQKQYTELPVIITVEKNVLRTVSTDTTIRSHTRVCLQSVGRDRYLVAHEGGGQQGTLYTCVQFVQRSPHVVQIREAEQLSSRMDPALCDELVINPWLIVDRNHVAEHQVPCSLSGGFSVRIFDSSRYAGVCDGFQGETRMESECARGEGLVFYFRHQTCVPQNLYMFATQATTCLANWNEGVFAFMLLKHTGMKYMWVMRYPTTMHDSFIAFVTYDLIADSSSQRMTGKEYMQLDSVRDIPRPRTSLCVDDYEMCEYNKPCNTDSLALTCPRTCRLCNGTRPSSCTLDNRYHGQWYDANNPATLALTVNTTFVTTYDRHGYREHFHCIEWDREQDGGGGGGGGGRHNHSRMLVTDFTNGCRPRYTCMNVVQKASSVLLVKLSAAKSWPITATVTAPIDCSSFKYDDDVTLMPNMFKSATSKLLYSRTSNSVECGLPSGLTNYAVRLADDAECSGSIVTGAPRGVNGFSVELRGCTAASFEMQHTCVESGRLLPTTLLIVTRSASEPDRIYCWVFPRGRGATAGGASVFYLLEPSQCNESVRRRIRKGRVRALATFSKTRLPNNNNKRRSTTTVSPPSLSSSSSTDGGGSVLLPTSTHRLSMDDRKAVTTASNTSRPSTTTTAEGAASAADDDDQTLSATPFVVVAAVLFLIVFQIPCTCKT